ncbi:MAG: hypothetical protein HOE73_02525, partial [Bacteroidetes Order II. Incertae sedis bacterium]|nr:hypothetical protein [Bacteroidetes Order II. bacterium]
MELLLPIILILLGAAFIVAEVYLIPGMNVVGILGALMMLFAIFTAFVQIGFLAGVMAMAGATITTGSAFWWLWKS